ncbi:hypothetical protein A1O7_06680 [Cladophialophora yegresii CBS 114405]|uniref:Uncharacterized protein n=1 Tax=Cladophialophora yegresii CBS 114405 TaxID=1182544 RepID=W9VUJ0_9EURO|nr:uncharacterized protein A1O7_06680 [Cladophialophora yegresii CBS 114405]EXJ59248.1 hypothetical protein A1O7_06680 [Cladophialophora yegresii CBS 114405]
MPRHIQPDANGKLLRRFYEPLVLLGALDPTRGAHRPDLTSDLGLDKQSKWWRNFLDQLAFLCDFEKGGDTVTAIAVEKRVDRPIFWLASNSNSRNKARDHVCWILGRLNDVHTVGRSDDERECEVLFRCIEFSRARIRTYIGWLIQALKRAKKSMKGSRTPEDTLIMAEFDQLETLESDPHQLCAYAHGLRKHRFMEVLSQRHTIHSQRGIWSDIRHYIGRLGLWHKAIRILVSGTRMFPQYIEGAQVMVIAPNGSAALPYFDASTDMADVVGRLVPSYQPSLAQELTIALAELDAIAGIEGKFRDDYKSIRPRPHAELLVLEHFHFQNLDFVADEKYIGCSKPSCYCCNLYMQCHPGGFIPRACHGNLWINWAPPIPLPSIELGAGRPKVRPQQHHTFGILQNMLLRIRLDLQDQILSRRPRRARLPDSTTGMSSVPLDTDQLLASLLGARADLSGDEGDESVAVSEGEAAGAGTYGLTTESSLDTGSEERDADRTEGEPSHGNDNRNLGKVQQVQPPGAEVDQESNDEEELVFKGRNNKLNSR